MGPIGALAGRGGRHWRPGGPAFDCHGTAGPGQCRARGAQSGSGLRRAAGLGPSRQSLGGLARPGLSAVAVFRNLKFTAGISVPGTLSIGSGPQCRAGLPARARRAGP